MFSTYVGSMKKLKFLFFPTILALTLGLMISCSDKDESSSSGTSAPVSLYAASGTVQKGPFIQGSIITMWELDNNRVQTGRSFTGTIDDNTGSFNIKGVLSYKMVEITASGYYFNEVSGSISNAPVTLQALADMTDSSSVNVNMMTTLEKKRVEYLIDSGLTFAEAKTQTQTEIMKIFGIENFSVGNSETLDITKSGAGNGILLAISLILQTDMTEAELTELLSIINNDIRTDGTLEDTTAKATLLTGMSYVGTNVAPIRNNIESRYADLGMSVTIPRFGGFIDCFRSACVLLTN